MPHKHQNWRETNKPRRNWLFSSLPTERNWINLKAILLFTIYDLLGSSVCYVIHAFRIILDPTISRWWLMYYVCMHEIMLVSHFLHMLFIRSERYMHIRHWSLRLYKLLCRTHKWTHRMLHARNIYGYDTSLTQPLMRTQMYIASIQG